MDDDDDDIAVLLAELTDDAPSPEPTLGTFVGFESLEDLLMRNNYVLNNSYADLLVPVVPGILEPLPAPKPRRGRKKKLQPSELPLAPIVDLAPLPPLSCEGLAPVVECRKRHSPVEVEKVAREAAALVRTALQARQAYDALRTYSSVKGALGSLDKQANFDNPLEAQKHAAVEAAEALVAVAHLAPPRLARAIKKKKKKKKPHVTA